MFDPVTLESGRTYDRSSIEMLFKMSRDQEQDPYCPVNMIPVDPNVMIPNKVLRLEAERLLEQNPWAFEFDPRQNFKSIQIWEE